MTHASHLDITEPNKIGKDVDDKLDLLNNYGFHHFGFYITPPPGGTVVVEGTYDGSNWWPIAVDNSDTSELNLPSITDAGSYLARIDTTRTVRIRTSVAGTAAGSLNGRMA